MVYIYIYIYWNTVKDFLANLQIMSGPTHIDHHFLRRFQKECSNHLLTVSLKFSGGIPYVSGSWWPPRRRRQWLLRRCARQPTWWPVAMNKRISSWRQNLGRLGYFQWKIRMKNSKDHHTVDGQNPAPVGRWVYPIIYRVFHIPGGASLVVIFGVLCLNMDFFVWKSWSDGCSFCCGDEIEVVMSVW